MREGGGVVINVRYYNNPRGREGGSAVEVDLIVLERSANLDGY